jgi:hypothetical protein
LKKIIIEEKFFGEEPNALYLPSILTRRIDTSRA